MNVLFFIFKLIFSPVKSIYTMMTGKKRKTHFLLKPLKICLIVVLIIFSVGAIIAAFNEQDLFVGTWRENGTSIIPVEVDLTDIDEELLEENPDGSKNGLNLQLIDSIQTEGYVKEMLTLYRDSQNGKLDGLEQTFPLEGLLGIQINETSTYDGTDIPKSYIPFVNGKIMWKEPYSSMPAEAMTLRNINHNVIDSTYRGGHSVSGGLPYNINGVNHTTGDEYYDQDINVFQVRYTRFGMFGGSYTPANINGWKESSGRVSDPFYLPDVLSYMNQEVRDICNIFGMSSEDSELICVAYSGWHNGGSGAFPYLHLTGGSYGNNGSPQVKRPEDAQEDFQKIIKAYADDIYSFRDKGAIYTSALTDVVYQKGLAMLIFFESGWYMFPSSSNTTYAKGSSIYSKFKQAYRTFKNPNASDAEIDAYFNSKLKSPNVDSSLVGTVYRSDINNFSSQYSAMYKVRDFNSSVYKAGSHPPIQIVNVVNAGHVVASCYAGKFAYASMLKYAGVNVDPTDPNSYMNTLPEGEWKPGGDSVWMNNYKEIDQSKLNSKREAFLNEAYKWLGSWYVYGGQYVPEKDANGNWIDGNPVGKTPSGNGSMKGFDCSFLIQYSAKQTLGIDITRSTYSQLASGTLEKISKSEMKPGDLVYCYQGSSPEHVYIYLGTTSDGYDLILHAPSTGKTVEIRVMNYPYYYSGGFQYYRIKGIDD